MYHEAVMRHEAVDALGVRPGGIYVDATFGGGGHAREILQRLEDGRLFAFDQDSDAARNLPDDDRVVFLNHNFRFMQNFLRFHGVTAVDGILADLGVSSHQLDAAQRGFSTRASGPLDMRMDQEGGLSAETVVNTYPAEQLKEVFRQYGEIPNAGKLVASIDQERQIQAIETTGRLSAILLRLAPKGKESKYMARVFQALRMEVNQELQALKDFLQQSRHLIKTDGKLVVIAYHSLEDRLVKYFMRAGNFTGDIPRDFYGKALVPFRPEGKVRKPDAGEINANPRARSARLRSAVRTAFQDGVKEQKE